MKLQKKLLALAIASAAAGLTACGGETKTETVTVKETVTKNADSVIGSKTLTAGAFSATEVDSATNKPNDSAWTKGWTVKVHGNNTVWTKPTGAAADNVCPTGTTLVSGGTDGISDVRSTMAGLDICQLPTTISADMTLTNDNVYYLASGGTTLGNGNKELAADRTISGKTLTINAGTLILGGKGDFLNITRGNKIAANGTKDAPIVFRGKHWSNHADDLRGSWGGIVLQGNGKDFKGTNVLGEGGVGYYAGSDNADNSGTMTYVMIGGAGYDIDGNGNELNALTFQGVGSGTTINHVQVHQTADDGLEFFGGAVKVDHVVMTDIGDDAFDFDNGFVGEGKYAYIEMSNDYHATDSRGIEGDGHDKKDTNGDKYIYVNSAESSNPTLQYFTIIGNKEHSDSGILLRRGAKATMSNMAVSGFGDECFEVRDRGTLEDGTTNTTTGVTTWSNTYTRFSLTNSDLDASCGGIDIANAKDDTKHADNKYADDATAKAALETWANAQTGLTINK